MTEDSAVKRTLMLKNRELLDFEIDTATGDVRILDAPDPEDGFLMSVGFGGPAREGFLKRSIWSRSIPAHRDDVIKVLDAFGARTTIALAFMGHGASLTDKLWYRAPGSTARWEDVNFYDNDWDDTYRTSILTHDYKKLASCLPDVPDITTGGQQRKAWERSGDCIQLVKEPLYESACDLEGALLAEELCRLIFGQDVYQPLQVVERFGRRFAASPLMIGRNEELVQDARLLAMGGFDANEAERLPGYASPQSYVDIVSRAGLPDANTAVAKMFAFKCLVLLADTHAGNFGIVRDCETGECHPAPPFDYDRCFGFSRDKRFIDIMCAKPKIASMLCGRNFSDLDPSWDWSWYDPKVLEGFEERIREAYAPLQGMPPTFGELVARLFIMQRNYVNDIAST